MLGLSDLHARYPLRHFVQRLQKDIRVQRRLQYIVRRRVKKRLLHILKFVIAAQDDKLHLGKPGFQYF